MAFNRLTRGEIAEVQAGLKPLAAVKVFTFSNAAGFGALNDVISLFRVTGTCLVSLRAYVETSLTGATATLVHGRAGTTNDLIPILTCTTLVAGAGFDKSAAAVARGTALDKTPVKSYFDGQTIIATNATAAIAAGKVTYICDFVPLTDGAGVEAL